MNILILNGSPRPNGNTASMAAAFAEGAKGAGHEVIILNVGRMKIAGCLGCEHCHTHGGGACIQKDDMQAVYTAIGNAEMLVIASPIYYFGLTGQLQCAIHRTYAIGIPKKLKKAMLILSSGSDDVYDGAVYEYQQSFFEYMGLENMGIHKAHGAKNRSKNFLAELKEAGKRL